MQITNVAVDACPKNGLDRLFAWLGKFNEAASARLSCISYAWPKPDFGGAAFRNQIATEALEARLQSRTAAVRRMFSEDAIFSHGMVEWCSGVGTPEEAILEHLYTSDLLVTIAEVDEECVTPDPVDLAIRSGTPVLRLKRGVEANPIGVAVIAWKDCASSRRALHSSLNLLSSAGRIHIVGAGDEISAARLEQVVGYLGSRGLTAQAVHLPDRNNKPGAEIIVHALDCGADVLISGVKGERGLRDRLFGNATRQFAECSEFSWYLSG
ncbi:hypothetical protein [Novosphingobium cyanobacteriorum]|uniref:UspA domain-containing protein n=1 Tax=Novosphingobium cyanobacteriorum TaxID=3024215 RepID=A0ABT6CNH9_9SPHN|nr:hypothetical protein [Novosphingobium cyanobacteriorum]MDF8335452.1 hypothetical protein [Novosphingobium cyanobacteriorum]